MAKLVPTIGLRDLCYALYDEETQEYGTVKKAVGAIDATITPSTETTTLYADDGAYDVVSSLGDIEISLEQAVLPDNVLADWLGHKVDANGALVRGKDDIAPYIALGFRSIMSTGKFMYVWIYRCKASLPEMSAHTMEGTSITHSTRTLSLTASPREKDGLWQVTLNEMEGGINDAAIATFLTEVYEPEFGTTP